MKKFFILALMLSMTASAMAVEVKIDGLCYDLVNKTKEAKVIRNNNSYYSGNKIIPNMVEYEGVAYNVTSIGENAFSYCTSLTSVTIPESVKSIGNAAFYRCVALTSVYITDLASWFNIQFHEDEFSNPLTYAEHLYINNQEITDLVIPDGFTNIGARAFYGFRSLTSVFIPNSVTTINDFAFCNCSNLKSVNIPNSVTSIGVYAFNWCKELTTIDIPNSVISIGHNAFYNCTGLTSVTIPNSVTSIEMGVFADCTNLTSVSLPNSLTSIGSSAFSGCSSLTSITIPQNVTSIEGTAFRRSGLITVNIPSSVTTIGDSAFEHCSKLKTVTIPNSVKSIQWLAFSNCPELTDVYCYAENMPIMKDRYGYKCTDIFEGSYIEYATLHVPSVVINEYRTTEPWKMFGTIVTIDGETPVVEQCAMPTIHFANGKLSFQCETEGVEFVSEITDADIRTYYSNEIDLSATYNITVYAQKTDYENSETATATLCWIEAEPQTEGITDDAVSVKEVKAVPVLIQTSGTQLSIEGAPAGAGIAIFDLNGRLIGQTKAAATGTTKIAVPAGEKMLIVKVGEKSVKVVR